MAKVLVIGGAGFIGSHRTTALVERGDEVIVVDNLSTSHENLDHLDGRFTLIKGDVLELEMLRHAMVGVEFVFHQAALASVPRSIAAPLETHAACATGTLNVLEAARATGVSRGIYAGSSSA